MAQSLFARMFARRADRKTWKERLQSDVGDGPPSAMEHLSFTTTQRKDPWLVEWENRRQGISDQYWKEKRRMQYQRRLSERDLKRELERERDDINRYYRLHELKPNDPRRARAERLALQRYRSAERQLERKHRDYWHQELRKLQITRDQEKRHVTRDMKREYRESREIPGEVGPPGPVSPPTRGGMLP